jgi:hypothetical protein
LLSYLGILIAVVISSIKVIRRNKNYDPIFVAMFAAWACYQVQSVISINQIGLAIWGWLLGGAVIAYERVTRTTNQDNPKSINSGSKKNRTSTKQGFGVSPFMVGILGGVVGLLIASPPYNSDTNWKSALGSGSLQQVEQALTPGYLNPLSSARYANATEIFESSKLYDQAYKYAKIGVDFNPDSFDAWKMLYYIQKSTPADRDLAKKNLERLDPMNKNIFDVPKQ